MAEKHRYREIEYVVAIDPNPYDDTVSFFPSIVVDGIRHDSCLKTYEWNAPMEDPKLMSLAYGAAQALCDQENASLQGRGLNRVRQA